MSTATSSYYSVALDPSDDNNPITNQTILDTVNDTVDDINKLMDDMINLGATDKILQYQMDHIDSSSDTAINTIVTITMYLICGGISEVAGCMADAMNLVKDLMSLNTETQNSFLDLANGDSTDATGLTDGLDAFQSTAFSVTYVDSSGKKTTTTVNGLLTVLSTPEYWPGGRSPLSTQTAQLLQDSYSDATTAVTSGGSSASQVATTVSKWGDASSDTDSSSGIKTMNSSIDQVSTDFDNAQSQLTQQSNQQQTEMSYIGQTLNQFQELWYNMMYDQYQIMSTEQSNISSS